MPIFSYLHRLEVSKKVSTFAEYLRMNRFYQDYSEYLAQIFPGVKVQKLSIDAGFSCPNRDGTIGRGGCAYCNVNSFAPGYCNPLDPVAVQIEKGKAFFARKYPEMKFLAYFQAYTGTHETDILRLVTLYEEALAQPDVVGLVIGTRPDCLTAALLNELKRINSQSPVFVEIGAETSHDRTLLAINRGHTWQAVEEAVKQCAANGLHVGLHLIAGLPGETDNDVLLTVEKAVQLPIETLKLHQLQIVKETRFAADYESNPAAFPLYSPESYMELCRKIIAIVPRRVAIERFVSSSPAELLIAPKWGIKNHVFTDRLLSSLAK